MKKLTKAVLVLSLALAAANGSVAAKNAMVYLPRRLTYVGTIMVSVPLLPLRHYGRRRMQYARQHDGQLSQATATGKRHERKCRRDVATTLAGMFAAHPYLKISILRLTMSRRFDIIELF